MKHAETCCLQTTLGAIATPMPGPLPWQRGRPLGWITFGPYRWELCGGLGNICNRIVRAEGTIAGLGAAHATGGYCCEGSAEGNRTTAVPSCCFIFFFLKQRRDSQGPRGTQHQEEDRRSFDHSGKRVASGVHGCWLCDDEKEGSCASDLDETIAVPPQGRMRPLRSRSLWARSPSAEVEIKSPIAQCGDTTAVADSAQGGAMTNPWLVPSADVTPGCYNYRKSATLRYNPSGRWPGACVSVKLSLLSRHSVLIPRTPARPFLWPPSSDRQTSNGIVTHPCNTSSRTGQQQGQAPNLLDHHTWHIRRAT